MHISALLIPIAALAAHALAQFDPHPSEPIGTPAQATLIARESALVPGTIAHLGVRFSIVEHWHIYWDGQNDSGLPPMIRLDLPDGFEALPTQWPAPRRHILGANDLLDHVLEGDVLAIIPVRVPASAAPGSIVSISGHADWLVCDEACVPGNADLTISLPVVPGTDKARPSSEASIFERALVTIPVSMPTDPSTMGVEVSWNDRTLILHVPGATHLEFSPHASGGTLLDRFSDAVTKSDTLHLALDTGDRIRGVLRISRPADDRRPSLLAIDYPVGEVRNRHPDPAIGFRPWVESLDGVNPESAPGGSMGKSPASEKTGGGNP